MEPESGGGRPEAARLERALGSHVRSLRHDRYFRHVLRSAPVECTNDELATQALGPNVRSGGDQADRAAARRGVEMARDVARGAPFDLRHENGVRPAFATAD